MNARRLFVNTLTFARVPLITAWLVLAVIQAYMRKSAGDFWCDGRFWMAWAAGAMMLLAGLTDLFDGKLARRWNVVSQLGKMADPLMDKVFYVIAFPALLWMIAHQGESEVHALAMLGFTILYILRDLWVTFMRSVGTMYGANVAAMRLGKVRTALSFPAAGWIYAYLALHAYLPTDAMGTIASTTRGASVCDWWLWSCYAVEAFMIVLNVVSFYTYTREYAPYLKKALEHK